MLKSFFGAPQDQITPKASSQSNPFDLLTSKARSSPASSRKNSTASIPASTPKSERFAPLGHPPSSPGGRAGGTTANGNLPTAAPTTSLTTSEPNFNFTVNPAELGKGGKGSPTKSSATSPRQPSAQQLAAGWNTTSSAPPTPGPDGPVYFQRGLLTLNIVGARNLAANSASAKPYVVATFDQSEFVSRAPIAETTEVAKGVAAPKPKLPLGTSPTNAAGRNISRPGTPSRNASTNAVPKRSSLGGDRSAYDPNWKHEVVFDVVNDRHELQLAVYDHADEDYFLGVVNLQPRLSHGETSDVWLQLGGRDPEDVVTGEIHVTYSYSKSEGKRSLVARDFEFLRMIGKGTFGRVFQVRKKDTRRIYAMKVLSKKEIVAKKEVAHTIGERRILQRGSECPFLLGLKFSFQSATDLFLVMDYKSGGELFHHLQREGRFVEDRARFYTAEIVLGFEHLHKFDIVYRDLKPENILLDATGHIVLCDFGLSKPDLPSDALTTTFCGTTEYLAPEVLLDDAGYSKLVDFWSLGVLLFEMCCGWSPFYAEDTQQMYKNICFGKIKFPKGIIGESGKLFVKALLNRNPKHRLGAQGDAAELKAHEFFASIDWEALARREVPPPFKPVVESDESVANFDAEFTEANLKNEAPSDVFDEDDPSDAWLQQRTSETSNGQRNSGPVSVPAPKNGRRDGHRGSPLTQSVQEAFHGFSFVGDSHLEDDEALHRFRASHGR